MPSFDAIVIGGGVNGLACAGRLLKSGLRVCVLDAGDEPGGAARSVEFAPGYRVSHVAHILHQLDTRVLEGLDLGRHGLKLAATNLSTIALSPDGNHLTLGGAFGETLGGEISKTDQDAWRDLRARLLRYAAVLAPFKEMVPPRLGSGRAGDAIGLAKLGLAIRRLGRDDMREFLRLILINVADILEDNLTDDRLMGAVAFDAVLGNHLGPRSPNSLLLLLNRLANVLDGRRAALGLPKGGMGSLAAAMANAVRALGGEIRTQSMVGRIVIDNDRAAGVVLGNGETISARRVISAINPQTTFRDLVGERHLDTGFLRRVDNIRMRASAAKLHLALDGLPPFTGLDAQAMESRLLVAPSLDAVEAAFNPVKYGEFSPNPTMELIVPSLVDPSLAPAGKHVLSAIVQFAPGNPAGGWQVQRESFRKAVLDTLERYAPGLGAKILASELLTPEDLEKRYHLVGGNWHHGELAVERMFMLRPIIGAAQYEAPVPGLWLAGAGAHPGGGVSGAAGWNAAGRIVAAGGGA